MYQINNEILIIKILLVGGVIIISANGMKWTLKEIMRLVVLSVCPSFCVHDDWAGMVAPSCENFYTGEDMHIRERLLVTYNHSVHGLCCMGSKNSNENLPISGVSCCFRSVGMRSVSSTRNTSNVCSLSRSALLSESSLSRNSST